MSVQDSFNMRNQGWCRSLNTSYVLVQVKSQPKSVVDDILFKYIICVGSRVMSARLYEVKEGLNTSYVSVQVHHKAYNNTGAEV